jgi:hypothetical protein
VEGFRVEVTKMWWMGELGHAFVVVLTVLCQSVLIIRLMWITKQTSKTSIEQHGGTRWIR